MQNYIPAINDGIGSSVGLFENIQPIICVEEERFNRVKNWLGFPEKALSYILENQNIEINDIDSVVLTNERIITGGRESFY